MNDASYSYNDLPADNDRFGFKVMASALADIIVTRPLHDTPLTIGIYGPWGSGKSSLMKMIRNEVGRKSSVTGNRPDELTPPAIGTVSIQFEAWRYARHEQALWRALLICVVEGIRDELSGSWINRYVKAQQCLQPDVPHTESIEQTRASLENKLDDLIDSLYRTVEREELGQLELDWSKAGTVAARSVLRIGLSAIPLASAIYPYDGESRQRFG
jgi:KAP family P-loop domain